MAHFIVKSKVKLSDLNVNDRIEESDFASMTPDGNFVQLEYVNKNVKRKRYVLRPGIWAIKEKVGGLRLKKTSFVEDKILTSFVNTKLITDKIDCFFNRLHVYKEHGFEVPKRAALLFGSPGCGKTSALQMVSKNYVAEGNTAVVIWPTDKIDAYAVKEFIQNFKYKGVEKLILIVEDIGGVEIDQVRMKSDSSLLSLLDNQEKTFTIPTFIIATTNFPEVFLGNLTNRPGRFDDKIEYALPTGDDRAKLLEFFNKGPCEGAKDLIKQKKYSEFSPAHIKEIVIRSAIYDITLEDALNKIHQEIESYKKAFQHKATFGLNSRDED